MHEQKNYHHFVPAEVLSNKHTEPALWFIFQNSKLLVNLQENSAVIPCVTDLSELNLTSTREQYLGKFGRRPCFSAELAEDVEYPEGLSVHGLRQLFGLLEEEMFYLAGRAFQIMRWDQNSLYCGRCGKPTLPQTNEYAKICPRCGLIDYPQAAPAIIAAIVKDNQILLARAVKFMSYFYSVLAGFVNPGESLEECVIREIREEVGIEIKNIKYFGSQPWPFPNSLMIAFTAEYAGGEITIEKTEIIDAGWYTADNLPKTPVSISIASRLIDWFVQEQA